MGGFVGRFKHDCVWFVVSGRALHLAILAGARLRASMRNGRVCDRRVTTLVPLLFQERQLLQLGEQVFPELFKQQLSAAVRFRLRASSSAQVFV